MTTYEDVKRVNNVIYLPTKKQDGQPPYWQRIAYFFAMVGAAVFGIWGMAMLMFTLERVS